jgi:type I restriction enzyme S subunit
LTTTLADAIGGKNRVIGGPFGSNLTQKDYQGDGVPVIRGGNMGGAGRSVQGPFAFVSTAKFARDLTSNAARPGDIIVTQRGTLGQVAILPDDAPHQHYVVSQSQMAIRVDRERANRDFVYYFLTSPMFNDYIGVTSIQTGVPHINLGLLRDVEVDWPTLPVQRAIAATLGALDDKIELNRKMNATLEAMARALFRDWFVDFGPTRAKMAGRPPYLSPDLWPLFPDRLDAEGKPEGWEAFTLGQIADHHTRALSPSETPGALFEHFSLPAFDKDQNPALDRGATIKSNKTLVPPGAILLSKLNPEIPRVWLPEMPNGRQQIASTEFLAYTGKDGTLRGLLFCLFSDNDFRRMLQAMVTGTSKSHQRISPPDLLRREVISGTAELFRRFDDAVTLPLNRVLANRAETRTLAQTRDLLLPRLMSGELRLAEAERVVEAAQ